VTAPKANRRFRNMAHTRSIDHVPQSFHSAAFVELRQSFPSQVQVISQFVDQLMRFILHFRPADGSEIDIEMAMREALANAVVHGNGENPCKLVYVECRCYTDGDLLITIRDEGRGFDASAVPGPTSRKQAVRARSRYLPHENPNGRTLFRSERHGCADAKEIQRWPRRTEDSCMSRCVLLIHRRPLLVKSRSSSSYLSVGADS
jgi:anti-sigma regulatory factor (Ser/Thr protein kinase)